MSKEKHYTGDVGGDVRVTCSTAGTQQVTVKDGKIITRRAADLRAGASRVAVERGCEREELCASHDHPPPPLGHDRQADGLQRASRGVSPEARRLGPGRPAQHADTRHQRLRARQLPDEAFEHHREGDEARHRRVRQLVAVLVLQRSSRMGIAPLLLQRLGAPLDDDRSPR